MTSLESWRTTTNARSGTVSAVHTLWVTQGSFAVLSHVAFRALTQLFMIAPATVSTLLVTLGVRR